MNVNYISLYNAFAKAIELFGISILEDKRIIHIIDDFKGYKDCPFAKHILMSFIKGDRLSQINSLKNSEKNTIEEYVLRQALKDSTLYGYSQEFVKDIYIAILYSMGRTDIFCNQDIPNSNQNSQTEEEKTDKPHVAADNISNNKNSFVLNFSNIPFYLTYLETRNILSSQMNGTEGLDFELGNFKCAFFNAEFNGQNDVDFNVKSLGEDNKTTELICYYATNNDPSELKTSYHDLVNYLNSAYGQPTISLEGDVEAYLDWLSQWKDNTSDQRRHSMNLQAYILPKGTVRCLLVFNSEEFELKFCLTHCSREDKEKLKWRIYKPKSFLLVLPTSDSHFYDEDDEGRDYTEGKADNTANYQNCVNSIDAQIKQITEVIAKIISNTLHISMSRISLDSSFKDLRLRSLNVIELIMNIEKKFGISIPDKVAKKITSIRDAASVVKKYLDKN